VSLLPAKVAPIKVFQGKMVGRKDRLKGCNTHWGDEAWEGREQFPTLRAPDGNIGSPVLVERKGAASERGTEGERRGGAPRNPSEDVHISEIQRKTRGK